MKYGRQLGHLTPCSKSKHHGHHPAWEDCPECPPGRVCPSCTVTHRESTELCHMCDQAWSYAYGAP